MSLVTFCTLPSFVSFLNFSFILRCVGKDDDDERLPFHVALVQNTMMSSCVALHCFLCVAKKVLICNKPLSFPKDGEVQYPHHHAYIKPP
jgi:hypothetical protein